MFNKGEELIFTGHDYNIAKIYGYAEIFKGKRLIIEEIVRCPCDNNDMDKIKFEDIEGFYKAVFFERRCDNEKSIRSDE